MRRTRGQRRQRGRRAARGAATSPPSRTRRSTTRARRPRDRLPGHRLCPGRGPPSLQAARGGVLGVPLQQRAGQVARRGEARLLVRAERPLVEPREGPLLGGDEVRRRRRLRWAAGQQGRPAHIGRRAAGRAGGARPRRERSGVRATALLGLVAHDLVDPRCLPLALDPHEVQPAAEEPAPRRQRGVRGPGAQHANAVELAEAFQAAGEVDRVPEAAELHLHLAAEVPAQHGARVEADPDRQLREPQPGELRVEEDHGLLHGQRRLATLGRVLRNVVRRVPEDEQPVPEDLGHDAAEVLGDPGHHGEVAGQHEEEVALRKRLGEGGEVPDVREHYCDFAAGHVQARGPGISADNPSDDRLGDKAGKGCHGMREMAKRALQAADLRDARACIKGGLRGLLRKVEVAQLPHQAVELLQRTGDQAPEAQRQAQTQQQDAHEH
eukprot:CAMPEP_0175373976 /NCGR_PEP_ID=MMETSP0095-20121207/23009_1 /TAXON_ID=311494 /ORGANISM="Alexandrium monilatum, Strain CCMP3105" /LENGTH=438 /DNA_ID=CAMNT_0016672189 /DNA_START=618 /DNA_END=1932 /DNA_ORIENTATION=-